MFAWITCRCRCWLTTLFLLCWLAPARGAVWQVATDGNDGNAGTAGAPWRTIQRAAKAAAAGDVVEIAPGVYPESITVANSGTREKPIVFQAAARHGVTITGSAPVLFAPATRRGRFTAAYITLRGVVLHDAQPADGHAGVLAAEGWRVEDCVVEHCWLGVELDALRGPLADIAVVRTLIQDNLADGIEGGARNLLISDCILRRNNQSGLPPGGYAGACRFFGTNGLRVDGVISYDNFGCCCWLDGSNVNFTISDCTFFAAHGGQGVWHGAPATDEPWAGAGCWSEGDPGPGAIKANTIYSTMGTAIGIFESGFKEAITVSDNLLADCQRGVEFRAGQFGDRALGRCVVRGNLFKAWRQEAIGTTISDTIHDTAPGDVGVIIDGNSYLPAVNTRLITWNGSSAGSLKEAQDLLSIENTGKIIPEEKTGPLPLTLWPTTALDLGNPARMQQAPATAETQSIDNTLAQANGKAGDTVAIPAFGRTAITPLNQQWSTEVYDLQCRRVRLLLPNAAVKQAVETAIPPYAVLTPVLLNVRITTRDEYAVEAVAMENEKLQMKNVN